MNYTFRNGAPLSLNLVLSQYGPNEVDIPKFYADKKKENKKKKQLEWDALFNRELNDKLFGPATRRKRRKV